MDILALAQKRVTLHKSGAHYVGPCPACGGKPDTNRFVVNVAKSFAKCYSCGGNWDVIRFLKKIEGMTCPEAHRAAEAECEETTCPVFEKCSRGRGSVEKQTAIARPPRMAEAGPRPFEPTVVENPTDLWQKHAGEYVDLCHRRLLECPDQLDYLLKRGLPREAVEKYRLGWIPSIEFKTRKAWGLPDVEREGRMVKAIPFPQGILIPWIVNGHIHRLRLRKTAVTGPKDPRYLWIDGSGTDIICLNETVRAHCVVESDLDGLLIDWAAGDLVGAVPLGSCSTKPKATVLELLRSSLRILVSLDYDHEQREEKLHAPGAVASQWWYTQFPDTARRWPTPAGKDPGEAHAAGVDIRSWILKGLPPALQIRTVPPQPKADAPRVEPVPVVEAPVSVQRQLADGSTIHITDNIADYRRLRLSGKTVFTNKELEIVGGLEMTPQQAATLFKAKQVFGGMFV